ncbi:MAG: thioredoxin [Thermoproteales archaeon]|nr:thioredoxin [Thermoproteales archaeon]
MSDELKIIKRRMLARMLREVQKPGAETPCPHNKRADSTALNTTLRQCRVTLADFWAPWCGPCRMVEPVVESLAEEFGGKIAVLKVNVDENPDLAAAYQVMSIPTLILFRGREEYRRFIGFSPLLEHELRSEIRRLLRVAG